MTDPDGLKRIAALLFRLAVIGAVVMLGGQLAALILGKNPLAGT